MTSFVEIVLANADGGSSGGSSAVSLVLLLLIPVGLFFMFRKQRRQMREQQTFQAALTVGDDVMTSAGIFGTITGEDGPNRFWLEIDDDIQIRISRGAISGRASLDDDDEQPDDADIDVSDDSDADAASAD